MFVEIGKKKQEVFSNLETYLSKIKDIATSVDSHARVFLFGSVASGKFNMASDVDLLIVSNMPRDKFYREFDRHDLGYPFEFHIRTEIEAKPYFRHISDMKML